MIGPVRRLVSIKRGVIAQLGKAPQSRAVFQRRNIRAVNHAFAPAQGYAADNFTGCFACARSSVETINRPRAGPAEQAFRGCGRPGVFRTDQGVGQFDISRIRPGHPALRIRDQNRIRPEPHRGRRSAARTLVLAAFKQGAPSRFARRQRVHQEQRDRRDAGQQDDAVPARARARENRHSRSGQRAQARHPEYQPGQGPGQRPLACSRLRGWRRRQRGDGVSLSGGALGGKREV